MSDIMTTTASSSTNKYNNDDSKYQPIVVLQYDELPQINVTNLKSSAQSIQVDDDYDETYLSTRSISTYPMLPHGEKDGDPIADKLFVQVHKNRAVLAIADGCNWGKRPAMAAKDAIAAFAQYFNERQNDINSLQDAGHFLLRAFCEAHNKIVEGKPDIWEAGTTTLLGGLVLEFEQASEDQPKWGFLCASVGDCKAFLISHKMKQAIDVTNGNRCNLSDTRDPGGRLGPYVGQGWPDLRNLKLYFTFCEENDIALVVSDGVHDNLDPIMLGKTPDELNIKDVKGWEELNQEDLLREKTCFMKKLLEEMIFQASPDASDKVINPSDIAKKIIDHCSSVTHNAREFMQSYPNKKQPNDYREFPGKMDHTTCVAFKVGSKF
ncbi:hypothetical protein DICPUDRAFT_157374 [Dictyostelium purpureum]|uniref:PPM-type phosphatase domain-containing protein n=1 Tax=Dictyostelium purpureum TaxID=5786 RepID=F0ZYZ2_DICPU|nr:uncharacterized protein DICPUDRAFT_157374 [Dictyostelium purpureum]EGC30847.1 hypothetical protein DICPUDRAFT_157374 [Dictyostelium purpureum]|eukprot:XP_003292636.1 hypothetical protein DICPUDRAFT_157374 [Dictyostelium purpureum]